MKTILLSATVVFSAPGRDTGLRAGEAGLRTGAEEHEQPVLRSGAGRLQEGRSGIKGAFECMYIGPGEHGGGDEQVQIVQDLVAKKVDGIAVSPSNAAAMAAGAAGRQGSRHSGAHLGLRRAAREQGPARRLYRHAQLRDRREPRQDRQQIKPKGGTICIQSGGAAAANHNERMQGIRDTLAGKKSAASPGDRLTGQNGWTEATVARFTPMTTSRWRCSSFRT